MTLWPLCVRQWEEQEIRHVSLAQWWQTDQYSVELQHASLIMWLQIPQLYDTHTHTLSLSHTHTHTHSLSLTHIHTLSHSHSLTHTHTHTHSLSLSHTHTLTHTHTHISAARWLYRRINALQHTHWPQISHSFNTSLAPSQFSDVT